MKWLEFIKAAEACGLTPEAEILALDRDGDDALYEPRIRQHSMAGLFIVGADVMREVELDNLVGWFSISRKT